MKLMYLLAFLPCAAIASPLETDFDKIFADNAEKVIEKNGGQSIQLDSKILLSRNSAGKYLALDGSSHEAVGCVLRITLQSNAVGKLCPESLTAEQAMTLESNIASIADFYAANNVPQHPVEDIQAAFDEATAALQDRLAGLQCTTDEVTKFKEFIAILTNAETQQKLVESLDAPRLPVTQPCL